MFTVVYTFRVKPGMEERFRASWAFLTAEYRRTRGSLGSRLHRDRDGRLVAIALWPDRARWEDPGPTTPELAAAQQALRACCDEVATEHELELLEDLWGSGAP